MGRAAPVFAQLESEKAKEASAFLGLAEGGSFPPRSRHGQAWPCRTGAKRVGWMAGKEPEAAGHPSLGDACPSACGCVRGGRFEYTLSCARPACGVVLFQLECPVLLGTIFCPAVLLEQRQPTQSDLRSGSSSSGWPRVSLQAPAAGWLQRPREPLVFGRKDPGALPPSSLPNMFFTPAGLSCWHTCRKGGVCSLFSSLCCW